MDCICLKRKHRKRRDEKKFRPLSPHVSPAHSQPSSLGPVADGRLPKVNSTGLWIGAPSLYSGGPSPAYFYGNRSSGRHQQHHIQRSASELRVAQPLPQGGHRIYHSQQLAPVYEMPVHGLDIYDVYQFAGPSNGAPRSKLVEAKHSPYYYNTEFKLKSRLERSQSDAQDRKSNRRKEPKRDSSKKSRSSSHEGRKARSSSRENSSRGRPSEEKYISKSLESLKEVGLAQKVIDELPDGLDNKGYTHDSGLGRSVSSKGKAAPFPEVSFPPTTTSATASVPVTSLSNGTPGMVSAMVPGNGEFSHSATDSMKLLAKNKTDDQKTYMPVSSSEIQNNEEKIPSKDTDINYNQYVYNGDIYSLPQRSTRREGEDDDYDNPIISRMKEMVIEKNRYSNPSSPRGDDSMASELLQSSTSSKHASPRSDDVYEEIRTVARIERSEEVTVTVDSLDSTDTKTQSASSDNSGFENFVLLNSSETRSSTSPRDGLATKDEASQKSTGPIEPASPVEIQVETSAVVHREKDDVANKSSIDLDGATDDINKAGKRITASAFEFLDTYLSDDEGTESHIDSPPLSPVGLRDQLVLG